MWKAAAGQQINISNVQPEEDDEWETDPDFVNDVNEQEQRWGSATIQGSGRTAGAIDMTQLRKETEEADSSKKKKQMQEDPSNPSYGYGGKFGVEKDRMDQSAVGHEYKHKVEKHASQKDYTTGFGGKFGVQTDRVDKSAMSWDHKEKIEKHTSQKDYVTGFGGKFGVQTDRQDKSAVGWDHLEKVAKHDSQKDYSKGFGGKFGVQSDRQDKSAVGWDHHEAPQKHESQTDQKIGFGGKFGLQIDRVDKSAAPFGEEPQKVGTNYTKVKPDIGGAKPSALRAKFETMSSTTEEKTEVEKVSTPKKSVHAQAAMFTQQSEVTAQSAGPINDKAVKSFDSTRTAFLTQTTMTHSSSSSSSEVTVERSAPRHLDQAKIAQFTTPEKSIDKENKEEAVPKALDKSRTAFLSAQNQSTNGTVTDKSFSQKSQYSSQTTSSVTENRQTTVTKADVQQERHQQDEQIYENFQSSSQVEVAQEQPPPAAGVMEDIEYEDVTHEDIVDTGISAVALYDYQAAAEDEISFDPDDVITHIEQIDEGWWRGMCKGKYGLFPANYVQVDE